MSIFSNNLVGNKEIINLIDSFQINSKEMINLAREYNLPMPIWSVLGCLDKITGIFSAIWLDRAFTRAFFEDPKDFPYNDPTHCYCLADALIAKNVFKQSHIQALHTFEQFEKALQDCEPGIFRLTCISLFFGESMDYFPAHAITIIKFLENSSTKYQIIQCFQGEYSLSDFMKNYKNDFKYENYTELNDLFLRYFKKIYLYTDQWEGEEEEAYEKTTKVKLNLEGNPVPSNSLKIDLSQPRWAIERTTNSGTPTRSSLFHGISTTIIVSLVAFTVI